MSGNEKSFEGAAEYDREIRLLLPGYDLLHELVPLYLSAHLGEGPARVLVLGSGTGRELVMLAQSGPQWTIDAIDASGQMVEFARHSVIAAQVEDRVSIAQGRAEGFVSTMSYDAVVALLVGHFLPDTGPRQALFHAVGRALRPHGLLLTADISNDEEMQPQHVRAHLSWSAAAGLSQERLAKLEARLGHGFERLTRNRLRAIAENAGLALKGNFVQTCSVVGTVFTRRADK